MLGVRDRVLHLVLGQELALGAVDDAVGESRKDLDRGRSGVESRDGLTTTSSSESESEARSDSDPPASDEPVSDTADDEYPLGDPSGYMAPTKVYFAPDMSGTVAEACGVDGLTEDEYRKTALQPFDDRGEEEETTGSGIFLANNDYVAMNVYYMYGDWAEEGLLMAERALAKLGNPKPEWLNSDYYDEKVTALL